MIIIVVLLMVLEYQKLIIIYNRICGIFNTQYLPHKEKSQMSIQEKAVYSCLPFPREDKRQVLLFGFLIKIYGIHFCSHIKHEKHKVQLKTEFNQRITGFLNKRFPAKWVLQQNSITCWIPSWIQPHSKGFNKRWEFFGLAHLIMEKFFHVADSHSRTTAICERKNKEQEFWRDLVQALLLSCLLWPAR